MASALCRNCTETPEPIKAEVSGAIPLWVQGTLIRNGPGLFSIGDTSYNHWFDGLSLIHSFTFKNGDVYYRSKFLRSDTYMKNISANKIVVSEFGTMVYPDPCRNIFSKFFSHMRNSTADFTDNNLVNIIRYGDDYYTSSEVSYINQIDPLTLDTVGRVNYRKFITVNLATAHPHYDEEGNTYNMGTAITTLGGPKYVIFKVPAATPAVKGKRGKYLALKSLQQVCAIPFRSKRRPSYFHSFGMTENYFIFVEQPFKLDIIRLITAYFRGVTWGKCLFFDRDDVTLFHIINRRTGVELETKFYADAFAVFHHINAYEEDGHVVVDLITYKDSSVYDLFYIDCIQQEPETFAEKSKAFSPPVCQRFVIPFDDDLKVNRTGQNLVRLENTSARATLQKDGSLYCTPETFFQGLELPGINYKYNGKKYRYFYGSVIDWSTRKNKVAKVDTCTKTHLEWTEEDCYPSEPKFVASPDAVDEDDGVILSSVVSDNPRRSPFMLVLDAKTLKEIARASVNADVHLDLHGLFIPQEFK